MLEACKEKNLELIAERVPPPINWQSLVTMHYGLLYENEMEDFTY